MLLTSTELQSKVTRCTGAQSRCPTANLSLKQVPSLCLLPSRGLQQNLVPPPPNTQVYSARIS